MAAKASQEVLMQNMTEAELVIFQEIQEKLKGLQKELLLSQVGLKSSQSRLTKLELVNPTDFGRDTEAQMQHRQKLRKTRAKVEAWNSSIGNSTGVIQATQENLQYKLGRVQERMYLESKQVQETTLLANAIVEAMVAKGIFNT